MVADAVAAYLAGVFHELATGKRRSELLQLCLARAAASGRAKRLVIAQCDSDDCQLCSPIRCWWVVDSAGIRTESHPLGCGILADDFMIESPVLRFATDGSRVRMGAALGPDWYWVKFGRVNESGGVMGETLTDEFVHVPAAPAGDR